MIRRTTPVSRKRITYQTERVGTTKIRRVIVQNVKLIISTDFLQKTADYRLVQRFPPFLTRGTLFRINFYGGAP